MIYMEPRVANANATPAEISIPGLLGKTISKMLTKKEKLRTEAEMLRLTTWLASLDPSQHSGPSIR